MAYSNVWIEKSCSLSFFVEGAEGDEEGVEVHLTAEFKGIEHDNGVNFIMRRDGGAELNIYASHSAARDFAMSIINMADTPDIEAEAVADRIKEEKEAKIRKDIYG